MAKPEIGQKDQYSDEAIARRRDELAKHMLATPPRPLKTKKEAKPSAKGGARKQKLDR